MGPAARDTDVHEFVTSFGIVWVVASLMNKSILGIVEVMWLEGSYRV